MQDEKRVVDHAPVIEAARQDAAQEGARMVFMTVGELWRLIHRVPMVRRAETMPGALES